MTLREDEYADFSGDNESGLTDRDLAVGMLGSSHLNCDAPDAQISAIHQVLKIQTVAKRQRCIAISKLEELAKAAPSHDANEHFISEWLWEHQDDAYEDCAHSMAIIGMLAPFVEAMFARAFVDLGQRYNDASLALPAHRRWALGERNRWSCYHFGNLTGDDRNLVRGITELSEATGLVQHLPSEFRDALTALFQYRNKLFHHGIDWPPDIAQNFAKSARAWPQGWFEAKGSPAQPSFFCASDTFVSMWLDAIERILEAFGKHMRLHGIGF